MSTLNQDTFGFVMLIIEDLQLLIPQEQIKSLEMTEDMRVSETGDSAAGYLQFENQSWPIFCLNSHLALLNPAPANRRVCILLQAGSDSFGILCERALLLKPEEIQPQAIPDGMLTANSPLTALAIYQGGVSNISSAEKLAKLLPLNVTNTNVEPAI